MSDQRLVRPTSSGQQSRASSQPTLSDIQSSLLFLAAANTGQKDPRGALDEHFRQMKKIWKAIPSTSKHHYRIRKRADQWLTTTTRIKGFIVKNSIQMPRLTEAQYQELLHLKMHVDWNMCKEQVAKDREAIEKLTGLNLSIDAEPTSPRIEMIDYRNLKLAHAIMVASWNKLGENLQVCYIGERPIKQIFDPRVSVEAASLACWLFEANIEYAKKNGKGK